MSGGVLLMVSHEVSHVRDMRADADGSGEGLGLWVVIGDLVEEWGVWRSASGGCSVRSRVMCRYCMCSGEVLEDRAGRMGVD